MLHPPKDIPGFFKPFGNTPPAIHATRAQMLPVGNVIEDVAIWGPNVG